MLHLNSRQSARFGYWLVSLTMLISAVRANTITVNTPTADGTLNLEVTLPDGTVKNVDVPIDPSKIKSGADKAAAVFKALDKKGVPNLGYRGSSTVTADGSKIKLTGDNTAEGAIVVADLGLSLPGSPAFASLGFTGSINATGTDGNASVFSASFGIDNTVIDSVTLSYNQLSTPTADGLATALYNSLLGGLSPSMQSQLNLNLQTDTISFNFSPGLGDYYVQTATTSAATSMFSNVGSTPVPEPVTYFSLGTGLVLLAVRRWKAWR